MDSNKTVDGMTEEMELLIKTIYEYVESDDTATCYKINRYCAGQNNEAVSMAIGHLIGCGALEYHPTGIKIGSNPLKSKSNDSYNCRVDRLEAIKLIGERIGEYIQDSGMYVPFDDIEQLICAMPNSYEKSVLCDYFFGSCETYEAGLNNGNSKKIIERFCKTVQCQKADVALFTTYSIPSNLFVYLFNRSVPYYRMMCLLYATGSMSPELLFTQEEGIFVRITSAEEKTLFDRFKQFTEGYMTSCGGKLYSAFVECYLFMFNDYSVGIDSLDYLAYKMHGINSREDSNCAREGAPIFDNYIFTSRSVKYIAHGSIVIMLAELNDKYHKRAITPEKLFESQREMLFRYYVEDISEFKQIIKKYARIEMEGSYLCFDTNLKSAIMNFAKESELFDCSKMSKSFVRRYGGDKDTIEGIAKGVILEIDGENYNQLSEEQYSLLVEEFSSYSWTTAENAEDIFTYKCECKEMFSSYNMHRLGFTMDDDAYYCEKYTSLRDCLSETVFKGEEFFVDQGFKVNLGCNSFKREFEYFISNLMWFPVTEIRYVNLRIDRFRPLYRAIKGCIPLLADICHNEYMTAYKLKKKGTGVKYIDDDEFELAFYDALLMSAKTKRCNINKQRVYHNTDETTGAAGLFKYIARSEGGGCEIATICTIMKSEYDIDASDAYVRQLIRQTDGIFIEETDMFYCNQHNYEEANK